MTLPPVRSKHLNLFAFPGQTALYFWLIVLTLLGAISLGGLEPNPVCIGPLAIGLAFLSLRAYLIHSENEFERFHLVLAGDDLTDLQIAIQHGAKQLELRQIPQLLVCSANVETELLAERKGRLSFLNNAPGSVKALQHLFHWLVGAMKNLLLIPTEDSTLLRQPYTFGTPAHWYIAVQHSAASAWQAALNNPVECGTAQGQLFHELYHFKNGDYWQLGYVEALLRLCFSLFAWALVFLTGMSILLLIAAPDIAHYNPIETVRQTPGLPEQMRSALMQFLSNFYPTPAMQRKAMEINYGLVLNFLISSLLPFILIAGILRLFYWPKFWRLRELYADAGAVQTLREIMPFYAALMGLDLEITRRYPQGLDKMLQEVRLWRPGLGERLQCVFRVHPTWQERLACVADPERVLSNWKSSAWLAGSLALILDILLVSPLTLMIFGQWPMHFFTLVILAAVALNYLIPAVALGRKNISRDLLRIFSVAVGLRLIWLLFTLGMLGMLLLVAPESFQEMMKLAIASAAHYAGPLAAVEFDDSLGFFLRASVLNLAQIVIIWVLLLIAGWATVSLLQRVNTWYRLADGGTTWLRLNYLAVVVVLFVWGSVFLPIATIVLLRPSEWASPELWVLVVSGLLLALLVVIGVWVADRKYGRRCPDCWTEVNGQHSPGAQCPHCQARLSPWLQVDYSL